ncbi:MAG: hypothetical protein IT450_13125 [Phycisphaerales bacterium]|nr:hypothetical protein [Phycisphaerales bacterium]
MRRHESTWRAIVNLSVAFAAIGGVIVVGWTNEQSIARMVESPRAPLDQKEALIAAYAEETNAPMALVREASYEKLLGVDDCPDSWIPLKFGRQLGAQKDFCRYPADKISRIYLPGPIDTPPLLASVAGLEVTVMLWPEPLSIRARAIKSVQRLRSRVELYKNVADAAIEKLNSMSELDIWCLEAARGTIKPDSSMTLTELTFRAAIAEAAYYAIGHDVSYVFGDPKTRAVMLVSSEELWATDSGLMVRVFDNGETAYELEFRSTGKGDRSIRSRVVLSGIAYALGVPLVDKSKSD